MNELRGAVWVRRTGLFSVHILAIALFPLMAEEGSGDAALVAPSIREEAVPPEYLNYSARWETAIFENDNPTLLVSSREVSSGGRVRREELTCRTDGVVTQRRLYVHDGATSVTSFYELGTSFVSHSSDVVRSSPHLALYYLPKPLALISIELHAGEYRTAFSFSCAPKACTRTLSTVAESDVFPLRNSCELTFDSQSGAYSYAFSDKCFENGEFVDVLFSVRCWPLEKGIGGEACVSAQLSLNGQMRRISAFFNPVSLEGSLQASDLEDDMFDPRQYVLGKVFNLDNGNYVE